MSILWLTLLTINVFFFAISTVLQRVLVKESQSKPIAYAIIFQFLSGIMVIVFGLLFGQMHFPPVRPLLFNLILGVFLYAFANMFIFKSLKHIEASNFTVIFSTRLAFTIFTSSLFLQEFLSLPQIVGVVFLFAGIFLVCLKSSNFVFKKGDVYALIAALCFGFANSNAKFILHNFQAFPYLSYVFILPSLLLCIIYPKEALSAFSFLKGKYFPKMLVLCTLWSIANLSFFAALKIGNSSQTTAISLFSVVVTVLLSIILLHEKGNMTKKIIGSVISFVGILLLVL